LRSHQSFSNSRNSERFIWIPCSQEPSAGSYPEPDESSPFLAIIIRLIKLSDNRTDMFRRPICNSKVRHSTRCSPFHILVPYLLRIHFNIPSILQFWMYFLCPSFQDTCPFHSDLDFTRLSMNISWFVFHNLLRAPFYFS
jgi:hypothetical protein